MYETDATFNTNSLKLLLSVIASIDNIRATFPIAYCYITLELAASFKWMAKQLAKLAFYNCPKPNLIIRDFSKGLKATVVAKAAADLAVEHTIANPNSEFIVKLVDLDFPNAIEVVVSKGQRVKLQLCEWHTI
jgi:hypothetical protein